MTVFIRGRVKEIHDDSSIPHNKFITNDLYHHNNSRDWVWEHCLLLGDVWPYCCSFFKAVSIALRPKVFNLKESLNLTWPGKHKALGGSKVEGMTGSCLGSQVMDEVHEHH